MSWIRVGIGALAAFAVLAFGGVEPWAEAIVEIGAAGLFLLWGFLAVGERRIEIRANWLFVPWLGLGMLVVAQRAVGLSANPYATKIELLKLASYLVLCFLAVQSFRAPANLKALAWFLLSLAFSVSLFGIVQFLSYNGKIYWLQPLSGGSPFGPYVNHNHFAGFVELLDPIGLAMLAGGAVRRDKLPLASAFAVVPIVALFLSTSRAGIASFLFEVVLLFLLARKGKAGRKQMLGAAALFAVAGVLIVWLGVQNTLKRFEGVNAPAVSSARRISMFKDTWQIFVHHPWFGTGLGTLQTVYPRYESFYDGLIVDHAHNDYLELLADTGLIGGLCGGGFIVILFWRGLSNLRSAPSRFLRSFYGGALIGCTGFLLHSLIDFNLHIPANALLFFLLASLVTSSIERPERANRELLAGSIDSRTLLPIESRR
jgi:O-antigen ligase